MTYIDVSVMQNWTDIQRWRRSTRSELIALRLAVPQAEKLRLRPVFYDLFGEQFPQLCKADIGFYWPFKGEVDLRAMVQEFVEQGSQAALPVVVTKQEPLEFWRWLPGMKLGRGIWNIPIPAESQPVSPTVVLVPLLGFDAAGYRLGYGGGYYDRALAGMARKPLIIGVGYDLGRLETIYPQAHDIPMDAIVTESGVMHFSYRNAAGEDPVSFASAPCFLHELDSI